MRITIFETDHFEVAYTLIRLFQLPGNQLTIFVYPSSFQQLQQMPGIDFDAHQWVIKKESQSKAGFVQQLYRHIKNSKSDLLYLETVTDNFIFYAWLVKALPGVRIILTIHDINSFFFYKKNGTFRRYVRNMGKKQLLRAIKEFTVINSRMVEYLKNLLPANKKVRFIPGAFFDETTYQAPPHPLLPFRLVVPGSVDVRRRDYDLVFDLLEECKRLAIPVDITLLGGFHAEHGAAILQRCKEYGKLHNNLHWFESSIVDQVQFSEVMNAAHFILAPCVIRTVIADDIEEVYGVSLSSGNIGDIIKYGRPAIVPEALNTGAEISQVVIRYTAAKEIPEQLLLLRDHPEKYVEFVNQALLGSKAFTLESLRSLHPDLFMVNS